MDSVPKCSKSILSNIQKYPKYSKSIETVHLWSGVQSLYMFIEASRVLKTNMKTNAVTRAYEGVLETTGSWVSLNLT